MTESPVVLGVDIGGTFVDLLLVDETTGQFRIAKSPSQRGDEAAGFANGLKALGDIHGAFAAVHGTTVGTNALLERKFARTGVITTRGFRDVLEMRRRDRPHTWGLTGDFCPPVERDMRLEVSERTLASGEIRSSLDLAEFEQAARQLIAWGAQAIAIVFVNAWANPANEKQAIEALRRLWPDGSCVASHEILPEIREFERTSTTVLNAVLLPVAGTYLATIAAQMPPNNDGGFHIVQSNGGVMSVEMARRFPVRTALSGPAAGVVAACEIASQAGFPNVISADLGGTSFDVSLIAAGKPAMRAQASIGFGYTIRTPMIEITTIGAGGGSIAHVDSGGFLNIGPQSAGSVPGPACYGAGGDSATLTDALVVCGFIDPRKPIGNRPDFDVDQARRVIHRDIATPLGLETMVAAEAIIRVADNRMAGAIRLVSIERGHDPAAFALMPFGGGGALHACALIDSVGIASAVVPRFPGVTSALGCVIADFRHDRVQSIERPLLDCDVKELRQRLQSMFEETSEAVRSAGVRLDVIEAELQMDMNYLGQTHSIAVGLPSEFLHVDFDHATLINLFENAYQRSFSRLLRETPIKAANLRVAAIGKRPKIDLSIFAPPKDASVQAARRPSRDVWHDGQWRKMDIYSRLDLPADAIIAGPAILEQDDATVFVAEGFSALVDRAGNLIIKRQKAS